MNLHGLGWNPPFRQIPSRRERENLAAISFSVLGRAFRRDGAGPLGDQMVMLDPPVLCKIEHRLLVEAADVEIAFGDEDLIAIAGRLRDDFTGWSDDAAAGEEFASLFVAGLGDADDPCTVLVGAGLHAQVIVEVREVIVHRYPGKMGRRVVATKDQFDALHAHDTISLGPAPIVADAHADISAEGAPDRKSQIARLEVTLLEMLKRIMRPVIGVAHSPWHRALQ